MDAFLKTLQTLPEVAELVSRVENGGCPAVLTGTPAGTAGLRRRGGGRRSRTAHGVSLCRRAGGPSTGG